MAEVGCLKDGQFQNLQVEGNTDLGFVRLKSRFISVAAAGTRQLLASESGSTVLMAGATGVITLPTAEEGLNFKVILGIEATSGANILTAANTQGFFGYIPLGCSDTDDQIGQAQIATTAAAVTAAPQNFDAMKFVAATATIGGVASEIIHLNCINGVLWHVSIPGHSTSANDPAQCALIVAR